MCILDTAAQAVEKYFEFMAFDSDWMSAISLPVGSTGGVYRKCVYSLIYKLIKEGVLPYDGEEITSFPSYGNGINCPDEYAWTKTLLFGVLQVLGWKIESYDIYIPEIDSYDCNSDVTDAVRDELLERGVSEELVDKLLEQDLVSDMMEFCHDENQMYTIFIYSHEGLSSFLKTGKKTKEIEDFMHHFRIFNFYDFFTQNEIICHDACYFASFFSEIYLEEQGSYIALNEYYLDPTIIFDTIKLNAILNEGAYIH